MQIKTMGGYPLTPVLTTETQNSEDTNCQRGCEETYITGENVKCYSHSGKQFGGFLNSMCTAAIQPQQLLSQAFIPEK